MKYLSVFLLLLSFSLQAQYEFAPLGAEWTYSYHRFVKDYPYNCEYNICDQNFGSLVVIDTTTIEGKVVSVLSQGDEDNLIYLHSSNDSVFFYAQNAFHLLYDFTAEEGDTITVSVPTYYQGPGSYNSGYDNVMDSVLQIPMAVLKHGPVMINGEEREVFRYQGIDEWMDFRIPFIIDGIGSGMAFFGLNTYFVAEGCNGFFICYEDENQSYTPFGCCELPQDFPERTYFPLGAEWLFEGYSTGNPDGDDCQTGCIGNYNLFRVEGEKEFGGRNHAEIHRYRRTKDTDWEKTDDILYLYNYDDGVYGHSGFDQFATVYRTDVSVGDTIVTEAVRDFPKWVGEDEYTYPFPSIGGQQVVEAIEEIEIDGQLRKMITYSHLNNLRIGTVIEGIGSLTEGLLGSSLPVNSSGCQPRLICYRDNEITFTTDDECGCEFPTGPTSIIDLPEASIQLMPNPSSGEVQIINTSDVDFTNLEVYDALGNLILQNRFYSTLDLTRMKNGIYLLVLKSGSQRVVKRMVKH